MSTYILTLKHKDPRNDSTFKCSTAPEAAHYKNEALKQGYRVTVKKEDSHG